MLSWWYGKGSEGHRVADDKPELEPPETPAPVFAARALKSAIFGAPNIIDETLYDINTYPDEREGKHEKSLEADRVNLPSSKLTTGPKLNRNDKAGARPSVAMTEDEIAQNSCRGRSLSKPTIEHKFAHDDCINLSPTKPRGILSTPRTASRKKSVSFGNEVLDKKEGAVGCKALLHKRETTPYARKSKKADLSNQPKSEELPSEGSSRRLWKKTPLTQTLEDAREGKLGNSGSAKSRFGWEAQGDWGLESIAANTSHTTQHQGLGVDMTFDLNEPQSQSGRYWKSQYQSYHEQARGEMEQLLKYKYLAKSYAKKKDSEAVDLAEKLKDEQRKVAEMEGRLHELSSKISTPGFESTEGSLELVQEVARQRALIVQYKDQVEEFRIALEEPEGRPKGSEKHEKTESRKRRRQSKEADMQNDEVAVQLEEPDRVRIELSRAHHVSAGVEKQNRKLQEENTRLNQQVLHANLRVEKQRESNEKRKQSYHDELDKKDEALRKLQKEYNTIKDLAKSNRRDAEDLLRKRHDQVKELKAEISFLRKSETKIKDLEKALQFKSDEHDEIVSDLRKQLVQARKHETFMTEPAVTDSFQPRESQIPVLKHSIPRPSKATTSSGLSRSHQHPLSEIVNNANVDTVPPRSFGPVQSTPMTKRFADLGIESPAMDLPSIEGPFSQNMSRKIPGRTCQPSPRPAFVNIPSSPPKVAMMRPRSSVEVLRKKSNGGLAPRRPLSVAANRSSTSPGSRPRRNLPPERAAAARARLEHKQAEKKRAQAVNA
ncbi:spindle pole body formation-associated protein-domain-containing protein [Amylocarpus encephaloides]|uniref:Spindle pole body formation-associated protein-domain-containing protein n=1 Tax=Amylocarpus encephaloides TaxID=45428 RepID=A0A9P7YP85_9HELO|nr:spindle pole body formation-associated protein-domain-containing protein [Amylocarpus encephaloides]